jgi:metal iron transporter
MLSGTTREDFNGMANTRILRRIDSSDPVLLLSNDDVPDAQRPRKNSTATIRIASTLTSQHPGHVSGVHSGSDIAGSGTNIQSRLANLLTKTRNILIKFSKFVGPGFMVSGVKFDACDHIGRYSTPNN